MLRVRKRFIFLYLSAAITCVVIISFMFLAKQKPQRRSPQHFLTESITNGDFNNQRTLQQDQHGAKDLLRVTPRVTHVSSINISHNGLMILKMPGGCRALDPRVLLYNRIFKTGSTTMMNMMRDMGLQMHYGLSRGSTEDWYDTGQVYPYPEIIAIRSRRILKRSARAAFAAHFYFRDDLALPLSHAYINQVREPVSRVVSHYFYMHTSANRPKERIEDMIKSGEYNETLEECFQSQHKGCQNNVMTRFFCGVEPFCKTGSEEAIAQAIRNINRYYVSVGLLEHFDVYLQILHKRLPNFFTRFEQHNYKADKITPVYNTKDVSNKTIESIREANRADIVLYEYIYDLFWKQAKTCVGLTEENAWKRP